MRFVFLLFFTTSLFAFDYSVAFSQPSLKNKAAQFEKFSSEEGKITARESYRQGSEGGVHFNVIRLTQLEDHKSVVRLRLEAYPNAIFINTDEIQSLVNAIAYTKSNQNALLSRGGEKAFVDVRYKSHNGLEFAMFEGLEGGYGISMTIENKTVYLSIDNLNKIDRILRSSLETMKIIETQ